MTTTIFRIGKIIFATTRALATRKDGPFRKIPKIPITGPHDYENWRRLQRAKKKKNVVPRTDTLKKDKHKVRKPKKKRDEPIKEDE